MSGFVDTDPKNFTLERTSGAQGADNPGGFGWVMIYDDGNQYAEIVIPDNVMRQWVADMSNHYQRRKDAYCAV